MPRTITLICALQKTEIRAGRKDELPGCQRAPYHDRRVANDGYRDKRYSERDGAVSRTALRARPVMHDSAVRRPVRTPSNSMLTLA